jgi:hypothetical protein
MPFRTAFENYLVHLKAQAEAKGKPPRWWANASKLSEAHIMPQWDGWTLAEMSQNPRAVKTWHAKLSKTIPTTADHCARLIRACAPPQTITMKGLRGMERGEVRVIKRKKLHPRRAREDQQTDFRIARAHVRRPS